MSARQLAVRTNPKANAPALGVLHLGSLVRLVRRQGAFALVTWRHPESGAEIQGWVFARYLKKFV